MNTRGSPSILILLVAVLALVATPLQAEQYRTRAQYTYELPRAELVAASRASSIELLTYAAITIVAPAIASLDGVPWDPDRSLALGHRVQHPISTLGMLELNDKLAHGLGGVQGVLLSFALDRRTGGESCARSAVRALLRVQAASALYEVGAAYANRQRWGAPGYGLGATDHLAVTIGSAAAAAGICALRS